MNKSIVYNNLFDFENPNKKISELIYNFSEIIGNNAKLKYIQNFDSKFYNIINNPLSSHFSFFEIIKNNEFKNLILGNETRSIFFKNLFINQPEKLNLGFVFSSGKEKLDSYLKFISSFDFKNPENIEDQEIIEFLSSKSDLEYFEMIFENQEFLNSVLQNPDFLYFLDNKEISYIFSEFPDLNLILKNDMGNLASLLSNPLIEDFEKAAQTNNLPIIIAGSVFGAMLLTSIGGFIFYNQIMKSDKNHELSKKVFYHKKSENQNNHQEFLEFKDFFFKMTSETKENREEKKIEDLILFQPKTCNEIYNALKNRRGFSYELKEKITNEILSKSNITNMLYRIFKIKFDSNDLIVNRHSGELKDFIKNLEDTNPEIKEFNEEFRKQIFEKLDSIKSLDYIIQTKMKFDNNEIFVNHYKKPNTIFSFDGYQKLEPEQRFYLVAINDSFRTFIIDSLDKMFKDSQEK